MATGVALIKALRLYFKPCFLSVCLGLLASIKNAASSFALAALKKRHG